MFGNCMLFLVWSRIVFFRTLCITKNLWNVWKLYVIFGSITSVVWKDDLCSKIWRQLYSRVLETDFIWKYMQLFFSWLYLIVQAYMKYLLTPLWKYFVMFSSACQKTKYHLVSRIHCHQHLTYAMNGNRSINILYHVSYTSSWKPLSFDFCEVTLVWFKVQVFVKIWS